ncbi:hypothetical protein [Corynebacterium belfantii]|uniref:hypothetical protein n=1 Tax=Corynebacterium belfantii TaxID=2014537 RepID=UPI0035A95B36
MDIEVAENELRFTIGSSLNNQNPALSTALAQTINQLHVFEPAPTAFVLDSGEHVELYTRAMVDTSIGLDDQALLNAIQKWGPYVYDFNERIFAQLQGETLWGSRDALPPTFARIFLRYPPHLRICHSPGRADSRGGCNG